jgi:hypothetical protein
LAVLGVSGADQVQRSRTGLYETDGATPAATVNAYLASSIKHDGEDSPFIRVGKGILTPRRLCVKNHYLFLISSTYRVAIGDRTVDGNALQTLPMSGLALEQEAVWLPA